MRCLVPVKSIIKSPIVYDSRYFTISYEAWFPHLIFACMKILMVCLGNICRSPLAEGVLQHKATEAGLNWQIESAGTNGLHNGEPPHHLSQKIAKQNGIDISKQQSRKFTAADFAMYDKIYAMAEDVKDDIKRIAGKKYNAEKVILFLNELYADKNSDVPDPWAGPEPGYHEVFALIDKTSDAIIEKYTGKVGNVFTKNKIEETI
jgi:protein-tyrosine phosphatase